MDYADLGEEEASYLLAIKEKTENNEFFRVGKTKSGFSTKILRPRRKKDRSSEKDSGFKTIGSKNSPMLNISKIKQNTRPVGGGG